MIQGNPNIAKGREGSNFQCDIKSHILILSFSPAYEMLTYTTICTLVQLSGPGLQCDKKILFLTCTTLTAVSNIIDKCETSIKIVSAQNNNLGTTFV
jgi:hypothetical protein